MRPSSRVITQLAWKLWRNYGISVSWLIVERPFRGCTHGSSGSLVADITSRYTPFGNWRTEPTANLTDRGFTGHLHHNLGSGAEDIGLVYMAARWYAPTLGRFLSADTFIPDPANPQSYNRYSYVENRPLVFTDPTGHRECGPFDGELCAIDAPPREKPGLPSSMTPLPTSLPSEPDIPLNEANLNAFNWSSQSLQWLQSQGYSLEEAIAFLLYKEASVAFWGDHLNPLVLDAITYKYNQYCAAEAGTASCLRGFWSYYQPMHNLWNSSILQGDGSGGIVGFFNSVPENLVYLSEARQVIRRPELGGENSTKPSGWATVTYIKNPTTYANLLAVAVGSATYQVFYKYKGEGVDELFIVLSTDQQNYHCHGKCTDAP